MTQKQAPPAVTTTAFDAVIFDLDGVITATASVHAAAWKRMFDGFLARCAARRSAPFQPFEIATDYRLYVDGKPRMEGLRSFLQSRQIELPEGQPEDPAGTETIHGLSRQKNRYFLQQVQDQGVEVYSETIEWIHRLKKHGFKTAVISSSKSCALILDAVNLADLFEVRVDGVDSEVLGIPGKPAPDIFLEAARQLRVEPQRAVVIEDAVAGVEAARAGQFGLIIGLDRSGANERLAASGADWVVADLSTIAVAGHAQNADPLPSALDDFEAIAWQMAGKRPAVFLDYDGTLTPIVETPELAVMSEQMRKAVVELARHCPVGIISGRDLRDVQAKVRIDRIVYAGSHGFDIAGPEDFRISNSVGDEFLPILDDAEQKLAANLGATSGVLVERKKFAIAVHYRLAPAEKVEAVEQAVDAVAAEHPELRKAYGKKIFELQPNIDWHKGKALLALLDALKLDRADVLPVFIGDDVTDEDAFRALQGKGISIVVRDLPYQTAAAYSLKDPGEVRAFLVRLAPLCRRSS